MTKTQMTLIALGLSLYSFSQHTFSIVAVDPNTGDIGSAGATCLNFEDGALAISDIVLNVGAIHTQSAYSVSNQANARARMEAGDSPDEIISWLQANDDSSDGYSIAERQYGVVDLNSGSPRSAAFTGTNNFSEKGHRLGSGYAIQGNILISQDVLDDMENAFLNTAGPLYDRLMAVMQAAKRPGADSRCLVDNISSGSAFIRMAIPSDTDSSYGNLWLDINVWLSSGTFTGDPIDQLQIKFDEFKAGLGLDSNDLKCLRISPNPTTGIVKIASETAQPYHIQVFDSLGKLLMNLEVASQNHQLNLSGLNNGLYFITITETDSNKSVTKKISIQKEK